MSDDLNTDPDGVGDDTAERVEQAIRDADVGADDLYVGLAFLGGLGEVTVSRGTATVEIALPVPDEGVRERLAAGVRAAAREVDGVESVDVVFDPEPAADPHVRVDMLPDVEHVVAVSSGKGGVGKSTVAVNLAVALADAGAAVGLLDADVYGPNAPALLGLSDASPKATRDDRMVPREAHGVRVMSMAFVVGEDDPVIWRGPLVDDVLQQLFGDVAWGELDYLVVDLPPGTGDAQLSLVQHLPVTGAVVVTTPQPVAVDDAERGLRMFARYDVPILGVVENMAAFRCPDCETVSEIFGAGGADALRERFDVPVLAQIPLDPAVGTLEPTGGGEDGEAGADRGAPGLRVPLVGRVSLPRTREEREATAYLPPTALREGGGESRTAFRLAATRTAARLNHLVAGEW